MFMNLISIFATLVASLGTTVLVFRAANRRIQLLALSVGLLTLCQTVLLADKALQHGEPSQPASEGILRLSAGALSLAVVHLLNRENKDRRNVDTRIRCYEPEPAAGPEAADLDASTPFAPSKSSRQNGLTAASARNLLTPHSQSEKPADRRRSRRYRVSASGDFRFGDGAEHYSKIQVENISRTGLCFVTSNPAALGSPVVVRVHGHCMRGVVVRCIPLNGAYQYGVELDPRLRTGKVAELLRQGLGEVSVESGASALNG